MVWASGTSHKTVGQPLHASFKLQDDPGEYLGLIQPDGATVASAYAPEFPPQVADISYGWTTDGTQQGYFFEPTPGLPNGNEVSGSPEPIIVSEIMYNTARGDAGFASATCPRISSEEYVELYNRGDTPVTTSTSWQLDNWWFAVNPLKAITGGLTHVGSRPRRSCRPATATPRATR